MSKNVSELCESYIELIKSNKFHDKNKLTAILKAHKYEFTMSTLIWLSDYFDIVEKERDDSFNAYFNYRMEHEYGYTREYNEKMDTEWGDLEKVLNEDHPEEMQELRDSHNKYHNGMRDYYMGIANGTIETNGVINYQLYYDSKKER